MKKWLSVIKWENKKKFGKNGVEDNATTESGEGKLKFYIEESFKKIQGDSWVIGKFNDTGQNGFISFSLLIATSKFVAWRWG